MIENQKNSSFNPLLSSTSRQFYTRRVPHRQHSNAQLDKVLRVLNSSQGQKIHRKLKTESRESPSGLDFELQNLKKLAKVKLQVLMRRQGKQWRQLFQIFQNYSRSTSKDILIKNQINFMLKLTELIKRIAKRHSQSQQHLKFKELSSKMIKVPCKDLETVRLSKENDILRQKLSSYESAGFRNTEEIAECEQLRYDQIDLIEEERPEGAHLSKKSQTKLIMNDLQSEVSILRESNDMLREQKKRLQQKTIQLKSSNQNLCEEIVKIRYFSSQNKQKIEIWRNIMLMQNQQINTLKRDIQDIKKEFGDLNRKYHNILKRFSSLSNKDQARITEISKKNVQVFSEQIQAFQRIRNAVVMKGFYQSQAGGREKGVNFYQKYLGNKESVSNEEGIKRVAKDYYRYYKPSFYVFLDKYFEYQGVDRQNFNQIGLPVDMTFLATLRSILDSKYNEYLLGQRSSRDSSSLANFTLSWLSNFMVDRKSKIIEQITTDVCFQTIGGFYIRLMSPYLNNNWEVITFRQFLLESLTIDELTFYLKARFLLLKGDGMTGKGAFMQIFYVNYVDALYLIQQIVGDFDYRKKMQEYLKRAAEYQKRNHLIDAHFILRLLLEYYQYKKNEIFSNLSKSFSSYLKERNISMPFEIFLKIFDYNSFELTLIEIVQIFQKAFSMGRGSVYLQNVFTVINQEGFLCKEVEKMFQKHVVEKNDAVSMHLCEEVKSDSRLEMLKQFFQKSLAQQIPRIGLESTKSIISKLVQEKVMTIEGIFQRMQSIFDISMFTLKKLYLSKSSKKLSQQDLLATIPTWLPFLKDIVKISIQKQQSLILLQTFLKKEAAKQILHFYRRKRLMIRSFISSCDQKERGNEHTIEVRKEFNSLIQNLKSKYKENVNLTSEKDVDFDQYV